MRTFDTATISDFNDLVEQTTETGNSIDREAIALHTHYNTLRIVNTLRIAIFHARFLPQFLLFERKTRKHLVELCDAISGMETIADENRDKAIRMASTCGDMARGLFSVADEMSAHAKELSRKSSRWSHLLHARILSSWAARIEHLARMAEDAAENLALGASTPFAELVQRELNAST